VLGLCDEFAAAGLRCYGRAARGATRRLQGIHKDFLRRHAIPTAAYGTFTRESFDPRGSAAKAPLVVKADGLAAGQGRRDLRHTGKRRDRAGHVRAVRFGKAADVVVIEEFLEGEEASFIAMVGRHDILPLATSQDHKRLFDATPVRTRRHGRLFARSGRTPEIHDRIMDEVMRPTVAALAQEGTRYVGFL
jgi:phosphoribosylamine--glycine ligase